MNSIVALGCASFVILDCSMTGCATCSEPVSQTGHPAPSFVRRQGTLSSSAGSLDLQFKVAEATSVDVPSLERAAFFADVCEEGSEEGIRLFQSTQLQEPMWDLPPEFRYVSDFPDGVLEVQFPGRLFEYRTMTDAARQFLARHRGTFVTVSFRHSVGVRGGDGGPRVRREKLEPIRCRVVD